jgi:hydroxymethylglutaryl-CoA lyase
MLRGMEIDTGVDLDQLVDAGAYISGVLGRPPVSRASKALLTRRQMSGA